MVQYGWSVRKLTGKATRRSTRFRRREHEIGTGENGGHRPGPRLRQREAHRHFAGDTGVENYLSQENMELVADMLHISVSRVYSVATFYENFSLEPKGKHIVKVCDGTACHVRKSGPIYDAIYEYLKLDGKRRTSADGVFTLETVACLGACGLAPVMTVDGEVYAKMTPETALAELEAIRGKEAAE